MEPIPIGTGSPQSGPADVFGKIELFTGEVADCKMREVQLGDGPPRRECFHLVARDAAAKERQLVAKRASVFGREVSRVVPPFGPKVVVGTMIARENIFVARHSQAKFLNWICCEEQAHEECASA